MVTEIVTVITGAAVTGGGQSTLYFEDAGSDSQVEVYMDAVDDFWNTLCTNWLDDDVTFQVQGASRRLAASNGELQQIYSFDDRPQRTGSSGGNSVPRIAQALIRWRTNEIINGRLLRGRNFIPGIPSTALTDTGLLSPVLTAGITAAGEQLIVDVDTFLQVWHRPVNGAGGSAHTVTGVSTWEQFAMLHGRRD